MWFLHKPAAVLPEPVTSEKRGDPPTFYADDDLFTRAEKIAWYFSRRANGCTYSSSSYSPEGAAVVIFRCLQLYEKLEAERAAIAAAEPPEPPIVDLSDGMGA